MAGFGDSFSDGDAAGEEVTTAAAAGRGDDALPAGERDLLRSAAGLAVTDSYGLKLTLEREDCCAGVWEDCEDGGVLREAVLGSEVREVAEPGEETGGEEDLAAESSLVGLAAAVSRDGWSMPMLEHVLASRLSGDSFVSCGRTR